MMQGFPSHLFQAFIFYFFAWEKKNSLYYMSALTGGHRDRNDHGIMEYCSGQFCKPLTVFKFHRLVSLRNSKALLLPPPPPLHTAAELIKTPTFNKTPHYHNNIKPAQKKPLGQAVHASRMSAFSAGKSRFPDANHAARLHPNCIVCILRGPWHLSPVSFQAHLFADIKTNICMKTNTVALKADAIGDTFMCARVWKKRTNS